MRSYCTVSPAGIRTAALLTLLLGVLTTSAMSQERVWTVGAGLGLGIDLAGAGQDVDRFGLAAEGAVIRRVSDRAGLGLLWDGAWFDGRFSTEKRFLLSAVAVLDVPGSPINLQAGPGLGFVTVVDVDFPEPGKVGDGLIAIGDRGGVGGVAGLAGHVPLGRVALDPTAHVLYMRAGHYDVVTLVLGGRVSFGG